MNSDVYNSFSTSIFASTKAEIYAWQTSCSLDRVMLNGHYTICTPPPNHSEIPSSPHLSQFIDFSQVNRQPLLRPDLSIAIASCLKEFALNRDLNKTSTGILMDVVGRSIFISVWMWAIEIRGTIERIESVSLDSGMDILV